MIDPNHQPRAIAALSDTQLIGVLREELARVRAQLGEYVSYEPTIQEEMQYLSRSWRMAELEKETAELARGFAVVERDDYAAAVRVLTAELAVAQAKVDAIRQERARWKEAYRHASRRAEDLRQEVMRLNQELQKTVDR